MVPNTIYTKKCTESRTRLRELIRKALFFMIFLYCFWPLISNSKTHKKKNPKPEPSASLTPEPLTVEKIEGTKSGSIFYFKTLTSQNSIAPLQTSLYEAKPLGFIKPPEPVGPYLILSAKPCENCLHDQSIYLYNLAENSVFGKKFSQYVYPGKIIDTKENKVVFDSRAFFGKCLPENRSLEKYFESQNIQKPFKEFYIVFQKEKVDRRHGMQLSVFVAIPGQNYIHEKLIERHMPQLSWILQKVKSKQCHEIEGRNRKTFLQALELKIKKDEDLIDEEQDREPEKEIEDES